MKKPLFLSFMLFISLFANNDMAYKEFLKSYNKEFETYKQGIQSEFEAYKKAYIKSLDEYKKNISQKWPTTEVSTSHKFVQYDKDYNTKKSVDFERNSVNIEVIAKNEMDARQKIQEALNELSNESVKEAYEKDQVEVKINEELNRKVEIKTKEKIIEDVFTPIEKKKFITVKRFFH